MSGLTWVGGGSTKFTDELTQRRRALQQALTEAMENVAHRIRQLGGQVPALPRVSTQITVATSPPGSFTGIDPARLEHLIAELRRAGDQLTQAGPRIHGELTALCVPAAPGRTVGTAGEWAAGQVTDLARRLDAIRRTGPELPFTAGMTGYGLFGGHAPDPAGAGKLLAEAQTGDDASFDRLMKLQERGTDPGLAARINTWWITLDAATRAALLASDPVGLGRLNGIPSGVRDSANRTVLGQRKAAAQRALNDILSRKPEGWEEKAAEQRRILQRVGQVEGGLAAGGINGRPAALLLAFDPGGPVGRAVISYGDPDTADQVVAYVPGLTTNLDSAAGDFERARKLWDETRRWGEGQTVASIAWLGYDAPQLSASDITNPGKSVVLDNPAERGGAILAGFTDGLRATHRGEGPDGLTILGHSYGSLVTGKAAELRPGALADRFVFVGSPGVGVREASHLGIDPRKVWVGEVEGDPVADFRWFGQDPSEPHFGARALPVTQGPVTNPHSSYWDVYSTSLQSLAKVVTDHKDIHTWPLPDPSEANSKYPKSPKRGSLWE
ncbi:alpha/beta hydrolase [Rhizohabitans arisaemae]|uniref:alpha/beta hydrolase n=1 Tax=Rhizohabitans arisaemae TaxID=2720610 RepID=UPI0024B0E5A2|nr:alpha/beta hydrolase [Rhizohabitans arisaemae]